MLRSTPLLRECILHEEFVDYVQDGDRTITSPRTDIGQRETANCTYFPKMCVLCATAVVGDLPFFEMAVTM